VLAGESSIHSREGLELVGHLIGVVKRNLHHLVAIEVHADALAADVSRVHKIGEDSLVHRSECTRVWADLALRRLAGLARLLVLNLALSSKHDVLARELLLQLTHEANLVLPEQVLEAVWDEDHNSSSALVDNNLLSCSDVQVLEERAKSFSTINSSVI